MTSDAPNSYYVFVNTKEKEIVTQPDGSYSYWNSLEGITDVVRRVYTDAPDFNFSNYGIALVTKTFTEFDPGNVLEFLNIDVICCFK